MTGDPSTCTVDLARRGLAVALAGINDDKESVVHMLADMSEREVRQIALLLAFQCPVLAEALGPRWQALLRDAALVMELPAIVPAPRRA